MRMRFWIIITQHIQRLLKLLSRVYYKAKKNFSVSLYIGYGYCVSVG